MTEYRPANIANLTLHSEVRFRYLNGKEVRDVVGWVDKISANKISVGNESHLEPEGLVIYHVNKYETKKIKCLEQRVE